MLAAEFNKKHMKKAEGYISQNIVNRALKMKTIIQIL